VRVGLFTESYEPVINGVATSVKTLAREMKAAGHEPIVIAPRYPNHRDVPGDIEIQRVASCHTRFNPENPFALPPFLMLPGQLPRTDFDVVHSQQPFGIGLHARRAARRRRVPHITTFHTLYTEYVHYVPFVSRRFLVGFVARYMCWFYNSCDTIIVPSNEAGSWLANLGVHRELMTVIPSGIPEPLPVAPAAVDAVRQRFDLPANAPILLYVGRFAPEKNLDLLVDSFADLIAGMPENEQHPVLLMVGTGPYYAACVERIKSLGLTRWIRTPGALPREELDPVYEVGTFFVFSSSTETQGMVLNEAQSHGLPCVAVTGGGAAEFVRNGVDAIVVAPERPAFTAALREMLDNDTLRCAYAVAARQSPLRLTPAGMAQRVIEVYNTAATVSALR
jgi:1,2-diacylglycerol 3-alpha-glucosyltransferase